MITIEYVPRSRGTIKLTNDETFKEIQVMFDDIEQRDKMVLNLLEKICKGEDE